MATERNSKGRFVKGCESLNKGRKYKCKSYNLTEEGKNQKIKNLGNYSKRLNRKFLSKNGYVISYIGNGKQIKEHHLVWLKHNQLHRIPTSCVIHHCDGNKLNNSIGNLQLLDRSIHQSLHLKARGVI